MAYTLIIKPLNLPVWVVEELERSTVDGKSIEYTVRSWLKQQARKNALDRGKNDKNIVTNKRAIL